MLKAIDGYLVKVETTLPSVICVWTRSFSPGNFDTHFVKKYYSLIYWKPTQEAEIAAMIALKQYFEDQK
jgi:propionyl-CoA carboxylase alpha chain